MKPAVLAAAALTALAVPADRIAHAGCAGSGGSGGGAGGGSGGGWYLHATGDCEDGSDVVGLRRCPRFAAWGKNLEYPHVLLEGGALVRRFPSLLDHQTGSVTHGAESFTYRVVEPASVRPRIDTAVLASLRGTVGLSRAVYGGLEVDLGGVSERGTAATEMSTGVFGSPDLREGHGLLADSLGVVGLRAATGFGGLGVELAGGLRAVSYSFHSSYHDCRQLTSITALGAVGEARARGELWLSPWFTAGVTVGTSLLERGAWMGGVYLGVHSRAFGGDR